MDAQAREKRGVLGRLLGRLARPEVDPANLAGIYGRAAREGTAARNPVIVIPGIMGSQLVDPNASKAVWGDFRSGVTLPETSEEAGVIALPMAKGKSLDQLEGVARVDGSLTRLRGSIGGVSIAVNLYGDLLAALGVGSYRGSYGRRSPKRPEWGSEARAVSFEFPYDWRRSIDETARQFLEFVRLASRFVNAQRGTDGPVKFHVIAHSMGGLMLRYFLRYGGQLLAYDGSLPALDWSGAAFVDQAVLVGPPNGGSLRVLDRLVSGLPGTPFTPHYDATFTCSMPSLYQLIPRTRHRPFIGEPGGPEPDCLDAAYWRHMRWGLANPELSESVAKLLPGVASAAERSDIAHDHLEKCLANARALFDALDCHAEHPPSLGMHLMLGGTYSTPAVGRATSDGRIRIVRKAPGDGVVLRSSALLDERLDGEWQPRLRTPFRWDSVTLLQGGHLELCSDPVFVDNALYHILEHPPD